MGFALAASSQSADDFALISLFRHIGGIPRILVPDNLKAAIDKADRLAPGSTSFLRIWPPITVLWSSLRE